jgi:hypothetical protein
MMTLCLLAILLLFAPANCASCGSGTISGGPADGQACPADDSSTPSGSCPPGCQAGSSGTSTGSSQCATDGSDYLYTETISDDGNTRVITTNYCPNHPYSDLNPNTPIKSESTITVPAKPQYTGTIADLSEQGGSVGILFNGAMIFSPYGGAKYGQSSDYDSSATKHEGDTFDLCGCHASSTSAASYHAHIPPPCLLRQLGNTAGAHSPQIGWAADGFPVYGPLGSDGIVMQTCTTTGGTYGTDVCVNANGGYLKTDASIDDYTFRYYFLGTYHDGTSCSNPTADLPGDGYFPNTPNGYYGCCPSTVSCSYSMLSSCGGSAVDGFTAGFTPTAKHPTGLTLNCDSCWASGEGGSTPSSCSESGVPSSPSDSPSDSPTESPTGAPTHAPTNNGETNAPTDAPTDAPINAPNAPTNAPTEVPSSNGALTTTSGAPSISPTLVPTSTAQNTLTSAPAPTPAVQYVVKSSVGVTGLSATTFLASTAYSAAFKEAVGELTGAPTDAVDITEVKTSTAAGEARRMLMANRVRQHQHRQRRQYYQRQRALASDVCTIVYTVGFALAADANTATTSISQIMSDSAVATR